MEYNHRLELKYFKVEEAKQDDQYRKEMLQAFNMEDYNYKTISNIVKQINIKYGSNEKMNNILTAINNHKHYSFFTSSNMFNGYFLLFSFDYFHLFHQCLFDLITLGDILDEHSKTLIDSINNSVETDLAC